MRSDDGITAAHYEDFRELLRAGAGLALGDNKQYLLGSRLGSLTRELGLASPSGLLELAKRDATVRRRVIEAMMTHETFWFRDSFPFANLTDKALPSLEDGRSAPLRIWSAACSFGQEPYSMSIAINEARRSGRGGRMPFEIMATDLSEAAIRKAKAGVYDQLAAARGLSPTLRDRYFVRHEDGWMIKPEVRAPVRFQVMNLMNPFPLIGRFDVIFCRNVLIYFSETAKKDVLARLTAALRPRGYLVLGASESLTRHSDAFETVRCPQGVLYRRRD